MPSTDILAGDAALERLEGCHVHPDNARALAVFEVEVNAEAERTVGGELLEEGFRYVGSSRERVKGSLTTSDADLTDAFLDAGDTTFVVVRRSRSTLPLSRYYFVTVFDDGSCIETVSQTTPRQRSELRLTVRGGHDDLVRDAREHLAAVRGHAASGRKVLPLRSLADVARIKRFYVGHVISPHTASTVASIRTMQLKILALAVGGVLFIAYQIWRALRR
jgi:hypothetical protein